MARRSRRRYYKKKVGRWAPNIIKIANSFGATQGEFFNIEDLAVNPVQTNTGVSQTFTVKNIEISFTVESLNEAGVNNLEAIAAYVMYVPQGMNVGSSYYAEHPEYIMAYKFLGAPSVSQASATGHLETQQYQPYKIRTRLSRKLQTGDKVILYIQGSNNYSTGLTYNVFGIVRWWTKAN